VFVLVQHGINPCGICGGHSDNGRGFFLSTSVFPISIIPTMLHTDSVICHWYNVWFAIISIINFLVPELFF